jgi:uncharacterized protein YcfL
MKSLYIGVLSLFALAGCVSMNDIDVSKVQPECARQCTTSYSQCATGFQTVSSQMGCRDNLKLCVQTCPAK